TSIGAFALALWPFALRPVPPLRLPPMSEPTQSPQDATRAAEIPLPEVKMHLYKPTDPVPVKIAKSATCAARQAAGCVRHVEFDVSGTARVGQCIPGQSIGIVPPGNDEKGRPHKVRLYSLASPTRGESNNPAILSTTVKRTIDEHWETH